MARLLIVSNRLPLTVKVEDDEPRVERSPGGLATGLAGPHAMSDGLWIGWPGDVSQLEDRQREQIVAQLTDLRFVPVWLDADEVKTFYAGFSNGVLWPLFHYLLDQLPLHVTDWEAYERVNERFAQSVAEHYQPGDLVWVHDYQLMLVPQLLRRRLPDARIGFFLHIPFPSSEIFRTLPFRDRILEGLLGADLIGFHTASYMRAFASSLLLVLGLAANVDRVRYGHREVRLGVFPMGVDAAKFENVAGQQEVGEEVARLRGGAEGCALIVGVDRLDYTKGIPRRMLAFETLLRNHPSLAGRVRMVQVAVPSRTEVGAYQEFRNSVEAMIGRINGAFGTASWAPIHYIYRSLSEAEVVALYRAADVLLVTPVRDGMNLVAKEFVAARTDEEGVLVLSEFAGAASELAEAIIVNPYDVDSTADALRRALTMPGAERRARMRALRRRVRTYDVHSWVGSFLSTLEECSTPGELSALVMTAHGSLQRLVERMRAAERLLLVLDYDGTLVPFASVPELAMPDEGLLELLRTLSQRRGTEIHLVSGSSREAVESWFGDLPIGLYAEHGFWARLPGERWVRQPMPPQEWREQARPILESFAARTPGSLVEEKTAAMAWHYRMAEPVFGAFQANELRSHLTQLLSNVPVEILNDEKVIELRPFGMNKGAMVAPALRRFSEGALVVAMGDDRTDEDLFAELPAGAITIHVGPSPSRAEIRLPNVDAARRLLEALLEAPAAAAF